MSYKIIDLFTNNISLKSASKSGFCFCTRQNRCIFTLRKTWLQKFLVLRSQFRFNPSFTTLCNKCAQQGTIDLTSLKFQNFLKLRLKKFRIYFIKVDINYLNIYYVVLNSQAKTCGIHQCNVCHALNQNIIYIEYLFIVPYIYLFCLLFAILTNFKLILIQ